MTDADDWNADLPKPPRPEKPPPEPVLTDKGAADDAALISVRAACDEGGELVFSRGAKGLVVYSARHNLHLTFSGPTGDKLVTALAMLVETKP